MKERVKMERRKTRLVRVGNVTLGYDGVTNGKIAVQSMTNTDTHAVSAAYCQFIIRKLLFQQRYRFLC